MADQLWWWWRVVTTAPVCSDDGRWLATCHSAWSVRARNSEHAYRQAVQLAHDLVVEYHGREPIHVKVAHAARLRPVKAKEAA